jgi:3'(2'), 5'-bisphosphate nucleotidase
VQRELEVALDLARRAGEQILEVYNGHFEHEEKEGGEGPVTEADRRADRLIREGLAHHFPNDGLLTEETPDDLARLNSRRVWIVDPLDGTRQFVHRDGEFAVMIGLAVAGRAVLGVVSLPCDHLTYAAAEGDGCREIDGQGRTRRLVLDPLPQDRSELTVTISRSHYGSRTRRVVESLGRAHLLTSGSVGRKAALVASGRADLYVNMSSRSRHWDACAPEVVVREAGGAFRDARGREIVYNTEHTRNTAGLLACRSGLLERVVGATTAVFDAS